MKPISREVFEQEMEKLYSVFGEKSYAPERLRLIWKSAERLPARSFEHIVDAFIAGSRSAPLPRDFFAAASAELRNLPAVKTDPEMQTVECEWCFDSGVCEVTDTSSGEVMFARCQCDPISRKSFRPQLPAWNLKLAQAFNRNKLNLSEWKSKSIDQKLGLWKEQIKKSQLFWGQK